jgi:hypothetical protein
MRLKLHVMPYCMRDKDKYGCIAGIMINSVEPNDLSRRPNLVTLCNKSDEDWSRIKMVSILRR